MNSLKPYLIRSLYEWIIDNDLTPYLRVDANLNRGSLPEEYVQDGKIILNIRPQAVEALSLGNELIEFNTRFKGKPMNVVVSVNAVMEIVAKENGRGMAFDTEAITDENPTEQKPPTKPSLRIVK